MKKKVQTPNIYVGKRHKSITSKRVTRHLVTRHLVALILRTKKFSHVIAITRVSKSFLPKIVF